MNYVKIYALVEPITLQVKYIGKTRQDLKKRLTAHLCESRNSNTKKNTWLKSLKKKGLKPKIEELDFVLESEWEFWEKYWISQFRTWGFELKNTDDGGKGQSSEFMKKNNPMFKKECRDKMAKSLLGNQFAKGYKHSEETRRKVKENASKFWLGKNRDKETIKKMSRSKSRPILQFDLNNNLIKKFYCVKEAVEETGSERTCIYDCLNGKYKQTNGFVWKWEC
jgi:group I intron endonuclease